jgi:membrane protein involved in colicin uptake
LHKTIDINKDETGEKTARTMSKTTENSPYTAMDYALKAQETNTKLLQQTSRAWIEGFRYQARLSQGMAQIFFGQWGNASASTAHVERPTQEQSRSEVTEPAAEDAQKKAEKQRAEKVAKETRKAENAAEETHKAAETAAKSAQKSDEPVAEETQKSTEIAAKDAQETQKSTETAAKDAQKNTETAAFPIDGYDEMNVGEVSERLDGLTKSELKRVRKYEKRNKDRGTLRKEMKQKIEATS